jgi:hypothetical protein
MILTSLLYSQAARPFIVDSLQILTQCYFQLSSIPASHLLYLQTIYMPFHEDKGRTYHMYATTNAINNTDFLPNRVRMIQLPQAQHVMYRYDIQTYSDGNGSKTS